MTKQSTSIHLVVAVDFSSGSANAARAARRLVAASGSQITLVHAPQVFRGYRHSELEMERLHGSLKALAATVGISVAETDCVVLSPSGKASSSIAAYAKRVGADLIIVGRRGDSTSQTWLVGSTSSGVALQASCPVLIVPSSSTTPSGLFKHALVAVDYSAASKPAITNAINMVEADGIVELVHIWRRPGFSLEFERVGDGDGRLSLADFVKETEKSERHRLELYKENLVGVSHNVTVRLDSSSGSPSSRLLEISREPKVDLVVFGSSGVDHETAERTPRFGVIAHRLLLYAEQCLLVIPNGALSETDKASASFEKGSSMTKVSDESSKRVTS